MLAPNTQSLCGAEAKALLEKALVDGPRFTLSWELFHDVYGRNCFGELTLYICTEQLKPEMVEHCEKVIASRSPPK